MTRALSAVLRLRRLELETAQQDLARALAAETQAERAHAAARAALHREARGVAKDALPALQNFTNWLPHGAAACQTSAQAVQRATAATAAARQILAERQAALRAAQTLDDEQRQRAKLTASRREAHALDEIVRGRRG